MITVREISENEIKNVALLEEEVFSDAWSEKSILETFSQKNAFILGAWKEDVFAGYVIFYYVLDEGEIARIATAPSCRRTGVAGTVFEKLLMVCEEKGIERILLDVRQSNDAAVAFYRRCGFSEDGIRRNFYENPKEHAILMSRTIAR